MKALLPYRIRQIPSESKMCQEVLPGMLHQEEYAQGLAITIML